MDQENQDSALVQRIQSGDRAAFRQLFDRYYRDLLGTAVNLLRDEDMGKDVVQEVFLQIWKNRETWNLHGQVSSYLKRAVINRSLNVLRRAKKQTGEEALEQTPSPQTSAMDQLSYSELNEVLEAALKNLPDRCRAVFVMKRLEGMSQKEIAEQLGISTKTVENQITKAVKALKNALQEFKRNQLDGT